MCLILGRLRNKYSRPKLKKADWGPPLFNSGHPFVFSHNCIAYRKVAQHEHMGSHEVFDLIFENICIDVRVIRGTIEC